MRPGEGSLRCLSGGGCGDESLAEIVSGMRFGQNMDRSLGVPDQDQSLRACAAEPIVLQSPLTLSIGANGSSSGVKDIDPAVAQIKERLATIRICTVTDHKDACLSTVDYQSARNRTVPETGRGRFTSGSSWGNPATRALVR